MAGCMKDGCPKQGTEKVELTLPQVEHALPRNARVNVQVSGLACPEHVVEVRQHLTALAARRGVTVETR